jgi:hypothetical protein
MSADDKEWTRSFLRWLRQVNSNGSITPGAKVAGFWIGDSVDRSTKDKRCCYSQATLANKAECGIRAFKGYVAELKSAGHLKVTRRGVDRPNWYHLLLKDDDPETTELIDQRQSDAGRDVGAGTDAAPPEGQIRAPQNVNEGQLCAPQNVNEVHGFAPVRGTDLPPIRPSFPSKPTNLPEEAARARADSDDRDDEEGTRSERPNSPWREFMTAYPSNKKMSHEAARREFDKLSADEQEWAIESAPRYRSALGAGEPMYAANWLKRGLFKDYPRSTAKNLFFVAEGTPEWVAWLRAGHRPRLKSHDNAGRDGWWFRSAWPPGHAQAAGAATAFGSMSPSFSLGVH